jgi:hypothetical protein
MRRRRRPVENRSNPTCWLAFASVLWPANPAWSGGKSALNWLMSSAYARGGRLALDSDTTRRTARSCRRRNSSNNVSLSPVSYWTSFPYVGWWAVSYISHVTSSMEMHPRSKSVPFHDDTSTYPARQFPHAYVD